MVYELGLHTFWGKHFNFLTMSLNNFETFRQPYTTILCTQQSIIIFMSAMVEDDMLLSLLLFRCRVIV